MPLQLSESNGVFSNPERPSRLEDIPQPHGRDEIIPRLPEAIIRVMSLDEVNSVLRLELDPEPKTREEDVALPWMFEHGHSAKAALGFMSLEALIRSQRSNFYGRELTHSHPNLIPHPNIGRFARVQEPGGRPTFVQYSTSGRIPIEVAELTVSGKNEITGEPETETRYVATNTFYPGVKVEPQSHRSHEPYTSLGYWEISGGRNNSLEVVTGANLTYALERKGAGRSDYEWSLYVFPAGIRVSGYKGKLGDVDQALPMDALLLQFDGKGGRISGKSALSKGGSRPSRDVSYEITTAYGDLACPHEIDPIGTSTRVEGVYQFGKPLDDLLRDELHIEPTLDGVVQAVRAQRQHIFSGQLAEASRSAKFYLASTLSRSEATAHDELMMRYYRETFDAYAQESGGPLIPQHLGNTKYTKDGLLIEPDRLLFSFPVNVKTIAELQAWVSESERKYAVNLAEKTAREAYEREEREKAQKYEDDKRAMADRIVQAMGDPARNFVDRGAVPSEPVTPESVAGLADYLVRGVDIIFTGQIIAESNLPVVMYRSPGEGAFYLSPMDLHGIAYRRGAGSKTVVRSASAVDLREAIAKNNTFGWEIKPSNKVPPQGTSLREWLLSEATAAVPARKVGQEFDSAANLEAEQLSAAIHLEDSKAIEELWEVVKHPVGAYKGNARLYDAAVTALVAREPCHVLVENGLDFDLINGPLARMSKVLNKDDVATAASEPLIVARHQLQTKLDIYQKALSADGYILGYTGEDVATYRLILINLIKRLESTQDRVQDIDVAKLVDELANDLTV